MSLQRLQNSNLPWMDSLVKLVPLWTVKVKDNWSHPPKLYQWVPGLWSWRIYEFLPRNPVWGTFVYILHSYLRIACTMPYTCMRSLSSYPVHSVPILSSLSSYSCSSLSSYSRTVGESGQLPIPFLFLGWAISRWPPQRFSLANSHGFTVSLTDSN